MNTLNHLDLSIISYVSITIVFLFILQRELWGKDKSVMHRAIAFFVIICCLGDLLQTKTSVYKPDFAEAMYNLSLGLYFAYIMIHNCFTLSKRKEDADSGYEDCYRLCGFVVGLFDRIRKLSVGRIDVPKPDAGSGQGGASSAATSNQGGA
jgi:hypothetical protein